MASNCKEVDKRDKSVAKAQPLSYTPPPNHKKRGIFSETPHQKPN